MMLGTTKSDKENNEESKPGTKICHLDRAESALCPPKTRMYGLEYEFHEWNDHSIDCIHVNCMDKMAISGIIRNCYSGITSTESTLN